VAARISEASTRQAVDTLAELAAGGRVLELAIGTGRLALPLAARGLAVHGIDASEAMVAKMREKHLGASIPVTIGDIAEIAVAGSFDLVVLAFNTLFNLTTQDDQVRCFQNAARHLAEGGVFVVEAFVPEPQSRQSVRAEHLTTDAAVLEASIHDPVRQTVLYQYIVFGDGGARLYPVPMRYAWPSEMDLMARLAGLALRERWGAWDRSPFTAESKSHVSVYGLVSDR
jgi:SAM-dependent methyltransferase